MNLNNHIDFVLSSRHKKVWPREFVISETIDCLDQFVFQLHAVSMIPFSAVINIFLFAESYPDAPDPFPWLEIPEPHRL